MKIRPEDIDRVHIISSKSMRICNLKKTIIIFFIIIVLIAAAALSWLFWLSPLSLKATNLSILSLSESQSLSEAQLLRSQITAAGGGGYIINDTNSNSFKVTAAVYKSYSDAEIVMDRLEEDFPQISIIRLKIKPKKISEKPKKSIKSVLDYPISLLGEVLDKGVRLDTMAASDSQILLELEGVKASILSNISVLDSIFKDNPSSKLIQKSIEFYSVLKSDFEYLVSLSISDVLSIRLKYFSCKTAYCYYQLRSNI